MCLASLCDILRCNRDNWKWPDPKRCNRNRMKHRRHYCSLLLHKCFPAEESEAVHHLQMDLEHEFCKPLSCDPEDYRHVDQADADGKARVWVVLGTIFLCVAIVGYYASIYMSYGGVRRSADLRRVKGAGFGGYLSRTLGREKAKAY